MGNQLNFNDIFKSNFIEKVSSVSLLDATIALGLAFALGLFIYFVYKKTFKGVMYSKSFSISLVALTMITTLMILAVTSNVVLSLGMVGALSIIRFRSAIKDPMDIAYLFWSIATGIVLGAGLIALAVFGALFIGIILVLFVNKSNTDNPYVLVINYEDEKTEENIMQIVQRSVKKYVIKSKTVTGGRGTEITLEIRLKSMETAFVNEISKQAGVASAVMVSYNGDYMS
ncbi:MAG: putative Mg(2+) transport ATPase [Firmicutes bacterium ADurb.Bin419]|nr:MAG: putative Mg(2+) transport ATPase [Firmicutes bacterium ADurb.Bin419]